MLNLYEKLQASPLFSGLTRDNLEQIIGQAKFSFNKYLPGQTIKREGEQCLNLTFLINGHATLTNYADDHGYSVEEDIMAPHILQPECLFGLTQRYSMTFVAKTACDTMAIDKNDVMRLIDEFFVVKLNLLNIISTISQKASRHAWTTTNDERRVARFLKRHVVYPSGKKVVRIKMTRLARETSESRLAVSKQLNMMQEEGLLTFSRGTITIPAYERLIAPTSS